MPHYFEGRVVSNLVGDFGQIYRFSAEQQNVYYFGENSWLKYIPMSDLIRGLFKSVAPPDLVGYAFTLASTSLISSANVDNVDHFGYFGVEIGQSNTV